MYRILVCSYRGEANMVIEKLHGLQATSITLNDRFTLLSTAGTDRAAMRMKKRPTVHQYLTQTLNIRNRFLIDQIARKLEYQMKRVSNKNMTHKISPFIFLIRIKIESETFCQELIFSLQFLIFIF